MATAPLESLHRGISVGRVLQRGFGTIGSNPVVVLGIAFLFTALPRLLLDYLLRQGRASLFIAYGTAATIGIALISLLVAMVFAMLTQGALVRATVAHAEGRRADFVESVMAGLRMILPLFLLSLVIGVCVTIGMVLLIVPGIILYLMWSVASPALVEEGFGVSSAISRSNYLTKGARWQIFGIEAIIVALSYVVSAALGLLAIAFYGNMQSFMFASANGLPWWYLALSAMAQTIIGAIWATVQTSLYLDLRDWKDGPRSDHLAEVFA